MKAYGHVKSDVTYSFYSRRNQALREAYEGPRQDAS